MDWFWVSVIFYVLGAILMWEYIEADPSFDAARKIAVEEAEREDDFGRVSGLYKRNWVKTTAVAISCLFWPLIALVFLFDRALDKR